MERKSEIVFQKKCSECDFVLEMYSYNPIDLSVKSTADFFERDALERLERGHKSGAHKKILEPLDNN